MILVSEKIALISIHLLEVKRIETRGRAKVHKIEVKQQAVTKSRPKLGSLCFFFFEEQKQATPSSPIHFKKEVDINEQFKFIATIGKGAYGNVFLVEHVADKNDPK